MSQTAAHAPAKAPERTTARPSAAAASPAVANLAGNQAMQALLRGGHVRAKLELGGTDDPEEREADAVADRVMRKADGACCASCAAGGGCEEETVQPARAADRARTRRSGASRRPRSRHGPACRAAWSGRSAA